VPSNGPTAARANGTNTGYRNAPGYPGSLTKCSGPIQSNTTYRFCDFSGGLGIGSANDHPVNVTFYGTKTWDITATRSGRSNFRTPKTVYDDQPGCVSQGANGGFDVSVGREFRKPGSKTLVKKETFNAVYNAEDQIICGPKPGAKDDKPDQ
jgi:hypothetical protein